jgi:hypothetical protein
VQGAEGPVGAGDRGMVASPQARQSEWPEGSRTATRARPSGTSCIFASLRSCAGSRTAVRDDRHQEAHGGSRSARARNRDSGRGPLRAALAIMLCIVLRADGVCRHCLLPLGRAAAGTT